MIVPMKKVTLIALRSDRESALEALRDIGVMQIVMDERISGDSAAASDRLTSLRRVLSILEQCAADNGLPPPVEETCGGVDGIVDEVLRNRNRRVSAGSELAELRRRQEALAVWGDFDRSLLDSLNAKGVRVVLCLGSAEELKKVSENGRQ